MPPKASSLLIGAVGCILSCAAVAQDETDVLAKIASEKPKQPIALSVNFRPVATQAQVMEFTRMFSIDVMQVTARLFTHDGEGMFTIMSLSAAAPAEQLVLHASCSFGKPVGSFNYSVETANLIKAELGAENRWWFSDSIVMTTAEEALHLVSSKVAFVQQIKSYGEIPANKFDVAKMNFKNALMSDSCGKTPSLGIF